ncbi:MAG: restriction endonuclease [Betaproteobacteria bacterium]|nr:restriction endonuclease [Betaproteobacteria bacterium]
MKGKKASEVPPQTAKAPHTGNHLYFGDNLDILREHIADESVDLIYLDPPFNSNANYNVLFKTPKGHESDAQIEAFEDTWHWGPEAEREFGEIVRSENTNVSEMMQALRKFLGENDMMAYLTMMANRLTELHRVLKPTGSLYLHCDPTASHYLKVVLDGVFGGNNYRSEISWKRSSAHNDAKQGRRQYGNIRDVILFYSKSDDWIWNWQYTPYDPSYIEKNYRHVEEKTGRLYRLDNLTAAKPGGDVSYEFMGRKPYKGRYWAYSKENMQKFYDEGRLYFPANGGTPAYKRYLDEMPGVPLQNDWGDIKPALGDESLGYPTQKPVTLLERIIQVSSNEGDVVLDPFCGCGTAVHAAQKLNRHWIGIDITHLAISLIEKRLKDAFPGIGFDVHGTPKDIDGARDLAQRDKYQFQWWACSLVNAQPYQGKKKGADGGIDGLIFFQDELNAHKKIVVSVKGGENVTVAMVRDLAHVVAREKAEIGLFVTLTEPTKPMMTEAIKEGFYTSPDTAKAYPKIQILTIEGLLNGTERADYPDLSQGGTTFKKAKREAKVAEQKDLF